MTALVPIDIARLSRLLDDLLALPAEARLAWLAALAPTEPQLTPLLRGMLAEHDGNRAPVLQAELPTLGDTLDATGATPGERVGPYRLLRLLGQGGMGSVWLAERADGALTRQVALKLPRLAWDHGLAARMARERDIGALLEHPNIARLYDAGVDAQGRPFLALEYIAGQPIDAWCAAQALGVAARLRLFLQVVRAVAYAHGRLVIHRDLKPANVLVSPDGQAHLLDFGIARRLQGDGPDGAGTTAPSQPAHEPTQELHRALTPRYASPEQISGGPLTVQSDVYALGVLLYELLTGVAPITPKRASLGAVEDAILAGDAAPASTRAPDRATARALRGDLDAILAQALQRVPARRYATADALAQDIERHLEGRPVLAQPDRWPYRVGKLLRRHWLALGSGALALAAVLALAGLTVLQAYQARQATQRERVVVAFVGDLLKRNPAAESSRAASDGMTPRAAASDDGMALVQARFADQPDLQAELHAVAAAAFADMGATRSAVVHAQRRVELLAVLKVAPDRQGAAQLNLGRALFADKQLPAAAAVLRSTLGMAGNPAALQAEVRVLLAGVLMASDEDAAAVTELDAAERDLDQTGWPGQRDPLGQAPAVTRAWLLVRRAGLLQASNQADRAEPLYRQAIDLALASEGAHSRAAIDIRLQFASFQSQRMAYADAQRSLDAAVAALDALGGPHAARAAMASARHAHHRWLAQQPPSGEPIKALLRQTRNRLAALPLRLPDWYLPQIDVWLGNVLMFEGDIAGAVALLGDQAATLDAAFTVTSDRIALAYAIGNSLMYAGRHDEADRWLRARLALKHKAGLATHPHTANDYKHIAQNLMMAKQHAAALAVLDSAPAFQPLRGKSGVAINPDRYQRRLVWTRAGILLDQGQAREALSMLLGAPLDSKEHAVDRGVHDYLLGKAFCNAGQAARGLPLLTQSLLADEGKAYRPDAPWLAADRATLGHCALRAGQRGRAAALAAQARAGLVAQPHVAGYFKAPLRQLEAALGVQQRPL